MKYPDMIQIIALRVLHNCAFIIHVHVVVEYMYMTYMYGTLEEPSIAVYHFDHLHSISILFFDSVDFHSSILGLPFY